MADTQDRARVDEGVQTAKDERARTGAAATASTAPDRREDVGETDVAPVTKTSKTGAPGAAETTDNTTQKVDTTGRDTKEPPPVPTAKKTDEKGTQPSSTAQTQLETKKREFNPDSPSDTSQHQKKKPRLVWTPELHMRFMNAVNHLGIKNAVPKTILQLMNVEGMTRENVASHLQKYRLYLKRLAGLSPSAPLPNDIMQRAQPSAVTNAFGQQIQDQIPFMPTMEQMHAGIPPTVVSSTTSGGQQMQSSPMTNASIPNGITNLSAPNLPGFVSLQMATHMRQMMDQTAGMAGTGHGIPPNQISPNMFPFGNPISGNIPLTGVADPYGQAAQVAYGTPANFGTFLNYMQGLHGAYGEMMGDAMPTSGVPTGAAEGVPTPGDASNANAPPDTKQ